MVRRFSERGVGSGGVLEGLLLRWNGFVKYEKVDVVVYANGCF